MPESSATQSFLVTRGQFLAGEKTPREFLESYLERIDSREDEVRAFVHRDEAAARRAADAATARYRAGRPSSLIDGFPIGLKDNLETRDAPTEFGSPIFKDWRGDRDAAVVFALRHAGAVFVGKLATTEFAGNVVTGPTRNPHDLTRTPGGSSSGPAAAVAAGMVPIAIGTQVIGSIIRPASFCGVVGFKPTVGSINRAGCGDIYSQNCIGTLSRRLDDAYLVSSEASRIVGGDPGSLPFQGGPTLQETCKPSSIAVIETAGWASADAEAKLELERALEVLEQDGVRLLTRKKSPLVANLEALIYDAREVARGICAYEAMWPYAEIGQRQPPEFSTSMKERIETASKMSAQDYALLLLRRDQMRSAYQALSSEVDVALSLSASGAAPEGLEFSGDPAFSVPFTTIGAPAISLPLLNVQAMPLGLQVVGFAHGERALSGFACYIGAVIGAKLTA